ncbi:MAG: M24 family metallopeptidase [Promethearchaeota archaeon]
MSFSTKIKRIRSHQDFNEVDAMIIIKPENIMYILGFKIESETLILIPNEDSEKSEGKLTIFLNALEHDETKKKIEQDKELSRNIEIKKIPLGNPRFVEKIINGFEFSTIGFEDDYITVKKFKEWKQKFKISNFVGLSDVISNARLIKTDEEIERIKEAARLGDIGFKTIFQSIKEGMSERELATEAEYAMRKAGSRGASFDTIVATGENSAFPHATISDKKVNDGDIVLVDIGAIFKGYCSDLTRTFIFGKVNNDKARLINLVNEGQEKALENVNVGADCSKLDKITRDFFIEKNKEWGSLFIHSLGHGVGLEIHERPYISAISQDVLKENMVLTIEPGLYVPGLGGARTEDLILIQKEGFESLSKSDKYYY